ncbi:hypothetical protein PHAMO_440004 [Magnetospirillum molischianum DSM 120]|uniref:Uncharacterized protein n=1 Tax=Magnetospirillum molischianum DSM 120 TaxID=1150626 RepID=H8FWK7_MAGML|nr:hypothetical protein PHAMO_440004 [Magnetospirillum molischianum DSM 120]
MPAVNTTHQMFDLRSLTLDEFTRLLVHFPFNRGHNLRLRNI